MENEIRIEYLYDGKPYDIYSNIFDIAHLRAIVESLQKKYHEFAEKVNNQNGYLELNLSHSEILENGIHHEAYLMNLSEDFIQEINAWEQGQE